MSVGERDRNRVYTPTHLFIVAAQHLELRSSAAEGRNGSIPLIAAVPV